MNKQGKGSKVYLPDEDDYQEEGNAIREDNSRD